MCNRDETGGRARSARGARGDVRAEPVRLLVITSVGWMQFMYMRGQNSYMASMGFELHAIATPGTGLDELCMRDCVIGHPVIIDRRGMGLGSLLRDMVSIFQIYRVIRRVRPAIVHMSSPKAAFLGAIASYFARVPVRVFLVRGLISPNQSGLKRLLVGTAEWLTSRLCCRTVFISRSLHRTAEDCRIVKKGCGVVLGEGSSNGIDTDRFHPLKEMSIVNIFGSMPGGNSKQTIGYVGRLTRDKGIEELATAWVMLRDRFPDARLLLVGGWEREDPVREDLRVILEQDPRVHITGFVRDVVPYFKQMTVFAFPSHREGFGNAALEASAMEIPVVATRVVGCVDAVEDGVTGTLVAARDATALADGIGKYLDDSELRIRHGKAGRLRAITKFRPEVVWHALLKEYVTLLDKRGLSGIVLGSAITEQSYRRVA